MLGVDRKERLEVAGIRDPERSFHKLALKGDQGWTRRFL